MKKLLLSTATILFATIGFSQTTLYQETFETGNSFSMNTPDLGASTTYNTWLMNNSFTGGAGTFVCLGFPFAFTVLNTPSQPVGITGAPSSSYMHISAQSAIASGINCASYLPADGTCALNESNFSKMTTAISTIGYTGVDYSFWWMCAGSPEAFGEVYYSLDNGVTWVLKQSTMNNVTSWSQMTLIDAAWDNQASIMFAFRFVNTVAATAADPAFSVDEIIVTGMGATNTITTTNDFTPTDWCTGSTTAGTVNFVSTGTFNPGNIYSAEFSDAAGSFAAPVVIGTLSSVASGSLSMPVTITGAIPAGTGYRVRVIASDPSIIGTDNSTDIEIYPLPVVTMTSFSNTCVNGSPITLSGGSPAGGTYTGTGVSGGVFNPSTAGVGTIALNYSYVDLNGCTNTAAETIIVNDVPTVVLSTFANVCVAEAAFTLTGGSPAGGTYSGTGVSGGMFDPAAAGIGTHTITYSYTDGNSCSDTTTQSILVDGCSSLDEVILSTISLYPNPAKSAFSISMNVDKVVIMDMNGRVVKSFNNQTSYEISKLNKGVYMVNILIDGTQLVRRLIIN